MSNRKLTDEQMIVLASSMHCTVGYIGKVVDTERWDYRFEKKELTPDDRQLISAFGLEIIFGDFKPKESIDDFFHNRPKK